MSLNMDTNMHPPQERATDINRGGDGFLVKKINFKMHEKMGKDHPVWEIPDENQKWSDSIKLMMRRGMLTLMLF